MSEYQEEVLTNLLDLQAELRGDEPASTGEPGSVADASSAVTVAEHGIAVTVPAPTPTPMTVSERLMALNERLAQLELDLTSITKRVERMEPGTEVRQGVDPNTDPNAPWRSFLDLQKIVADRLDH